MRAASGVLAGDSRTADEDPGLRTELLYAPSVRSPHHSVLKIDTTSPAPRPGAGLAFPACLPSRQGVARERRADPLAYAALWQPWHVALVRSAWLASSLGAPLAPVAWQLVQSVKGAATG